MRHYFRLPEALRDLFLDPTLAPIESIRLIDSVGSMSCCFFFGLLVLFVWSSSSDPEESMHETVGRLSGFLRSLRAPSSSTLISSRAVVLLFPDCVVSPASEFAGLDVDLIGTGSVVELNEFDVIRELEPTALLFSTSLYRALPCEAFTLANFGQLAF